MRHSPRRGRALTVERLYEFASWFPEHSKRLILLAGTVGACQHVWFEMTDDLLELQNGILEIPPELAKNARAHRVFPPAHNSAHEEDSGGGSQLIDTGGKSRASGRNCGSTTVERSGAWKKHWRLGTTSDVAFP